MRMHQEERGTQRQIDLVPDLEDPKDLFALLADARGGAPRAAARAGVHGVSAARTASLIGAPTDVGAADRGASMGPEALRVAGLDAALRGRELEVVDLGNLSGPGNPWQPPHDGYRHLPQVVRWNELVHETVYGELRRERLPILLGRRSLPRHRLDQRGGAPLPRAGQEAARAVARCARRLQHQPAVPERQRARHAARLPVRVRAARADRYRRA